MIRMRHRHAATRLAPVRRLMRLWAAICLLRSWSASQALSHSSAGQPRRAPPRYNQALTPTTDPAILYPGERDVVLTIGDVITIRLFSDPKYTPIVRINNDGTVLLPLIGIVHLEGLSVTQAERLIAEKLEADGMYRNPQVTLQITEGPNAVVTVIGEVHAVVPVVGSRHLLDVLSVAGGLPPTASHVITINRPGVAKPIVVDLGTDPMLSSLGEYSGLSRRHDRRLAHWHCLHAGSVHQRDRNHSPERLYPADPHRSHGPERRHQMGRKVLRSSHHSHGWRPSHGRRVQHQEGAGWQRRPIRSCSRTTSSTCHRFRFKQLITSGGLGTILGIVDLALVFR